MPFTVSHIAAVLPGHRLLSRAGIFTAAVIGSMVPDFGLLAPVSIARWQTHSFEALFTFCLPVGLAAYWLTLLLIRPAVLEVLPDGAYERLRAASPPALIWDAFTHENARGVRMFPLLSDYGPEMAGHHLQLYGWLQHGSSLVGLAVVVLALALWLGNAPAPAKPPVRRIAPLERLVWVAAYVLPSLLVIAWGIWHPWAAGRLPLRSGWGLAAIAVDTMRCAIVSLLLVSALIRARLAV